MWGRGCGGGGADPGRLAEAHAPHPPSSVSPAVTGGGGVRKVTVRPSLVFPVRRQHGFWFLGSFPWPRHRLVPGRLQPEQAPPGRKAVRGGVWVTRSSLARVVGVRGPRWLLLPWLLRSAATAIGEKTSTLPPATTGLCFHGNPERVHSGPGRERGQAGPQVPAQARALLAYPASV